MNEIYEETKEMRGLIHGRNLTDDQVMALIERRINEESSFAFRSFPEKKEIADNIFYSLRCDMGILTPYLQDESITEIMVNGAGSVYVEEGSRMHLCRARFSSTDELEDIIRRIAGRVRREFNELNPILDARLADGSRVNAVYRNVALEGPALTIRKFPKERLTMEKLLELETISVEAADFLKKCVIAGMNIFISGGTSSGKTTFLNCLSDFIPEDERLVVIEDSAELQIRHVKNTVRLECRNANPQGIGAITMTDLIKTSLRMRPDRIICGEVRGREVSDMINACNTGHDGSLSTGHGNSVEGMLKRLEAMYLQAADFPVEAIRAQIAEGLDLFVHLSKVPGGGRKVMEIVEIEGLRDGEFVLNRLFGYDVEAGLLQSVSSLKNTVKFRIRGVAYEN